MTVELHVDDAGFVRAPAALVYRRLTHVAAWPAWWRGARVRALPPAAAHVVAGVDPTGGVDPTAGVALTGAGAERWAVEFAVGRGRRLRYELRPHGWRHERGVLLALRGDVVGAGEFWLEPTHGGTVVHHLLAARSGLAHPRRVLADHRRAIRYGLWGLKDALQLEVRSSIGLLP